ncbi:protein transport protein Sec24A [Planococcus citri]|uniref:protein transport protein Sec24A n=1 Tax=Planococcus citri TaxID=170843 RepID=UPI0031F74748
MYPARNPPYSGTSTLPNVTPAASQNAPSYQNGALYHNSPNASPAYPPEQTTFARSQLQSPLSTNNKQNYPNMRMSNYNLPNQQNTQPLASPTGYPAMQNYGVAQNQLPQMQQPPLVNQQPRNNQMYQVNGYPPPQAPAQNYGQYPQVPPQYNNQYPPSGDQLIDPMARQFNNLSVTKQGFQNLRGIDSCDLLRMRDILPKQKIQAPSIYLPPEVASDCNCNPDVFRCTLTKIPETKNLLDKSRLPLGILLHPFRDLTHLSVIQCSTIVRCRSCRTYINPFVYFIDNRHWKCNLCFRANDLPDDFRYNPVTKMNDDPLRRPEVKNATIEFIASSEYMVRPPQPAMYLFILDVSRIATQTGYLSTVCEVLCANLSKLPGDTRTSVGFITVDSAVHFYDLGEMLNQPHELIVTDVDDIFIPSPENLIVNLHEQFELIKDLLEQIPEKFKESYDTNCALGAALQAAYKLMAPTGGRVTVFVSCLPNHGPGALKPREDPSQRGSNKSSNLNPATDFYKKLALDCNSQHVAVDLFVVNAQFVDLATISGISQVSGGCMYHFPLFNNKNNKDVEKLVKNFERYLSRKIGFEAVMRMRCTKGLSIHSFHGNFFVRTTDLLALPNINPDAGFGMQVSIDESLSDLQTVCFQAALLYTSSKGERRIRVHTLCLPVANNLHDVLLSADQQCIAGLLAKMAVDRSLQSSVTDAREAFVNAVCDILSTYKMVISSGQPGSLFAPNNLTIFPLYVLGLMKSIAFRLSQNTRTDDRVYAMYQMKCAPLDRLVQIIHPDLYLLVNLSEQPQQEIDGKVVPMPSVLQLSAERVDSTGVYLLDDGDSLVIFIGHNVPPLMCQNLFGYSNFAVIPDDLDNLPTIESTENKLANAFINYLQAKKPNEVVVHVIKDTNTMRTKFFERLVEDKTEFGISYYEFLQNVSSQMN